MPVTTTPTSPRPPIDSDGRRALGVTAFDAVRVVRKDVLGSQAAPRIAQPIGF